MTLFALAVGALALALAARTTAAAYVLHPLFRSRFILPLVACVSAADRFYSYELHHHQENIMGLGHSTPTPPALETCLNAAVGAANVGYPSDFLYQLEWVKPYNLAVNVTPAAVARPQSAAQVAAAVQCAAASGLSVQARSGGHSYANFGLGGSVSADVVSLDLSGLNQFTMDTTTWQATIGPGANLGNVTQLLVDNGNRAFAHGVCPGVGLGGHATVGGLGPMSRMWGSCLDHVVEAEVVTANGTIVRASETENSDLFWAIRGAGSSFGVVTEFVMRTHPAPGDVVQYTFDFAFGDADDLAAVFSSWQALIADPNLDRRFGTEFVLYPLGAIITGTFYGTEAEWEATGIPAKLPQNSATNKTLVVNDWLGSLTQDAENEALYLSNTQTQFYSKSLGFRTQDLLNATAAQTLFQYVESADKGTLLWFVIFDASGGAVADVPVNGTAFPHRDKVLFYQSYAVDLFGLSDTTRGFLTNFHSTLLELLPTDSSEADDPSYGTYSGYVDPALAQPQQEYYTTNLPALQRLKARWDPKSVFRNPQSVQPASS